MVIHLDDILIFSRNKGDHEEHVCARSARLTKSLKIKTL